jgi:hypothetical protein
MPISKRYRWCDAVICIPRHLPRTRGALQVLLLLLLLLLHAGHSTRAEPAVN